MSIVLPKVFAYVHGALSFLWFASPPTRGLDIGKMDTSFISPESKHNIHSVACADCHVTGVPNAHARVVPQLSHP
ncbi:MAG: hypothetical protein JNN01_07595 [Opitutaceae bacterium]|nr:hypothetical protein [Opitutaceae bacterium]